MSLQARIGVMLLVAMAVVGGGLLAADGRTVAQETTQPTGNVTITVSASGEMTAPPDLAYLDVAVVATAPTAEAAREQVAENVSRVRSALEDQNVSNEQVRTAYFDLFSTRENGTVQYTAVHGIEIRVPVDGSGAVLDAAVASGVNRVDGVRFTLADDTRRELRGDAVRRALENAREDADTIADATGVAVVRPTEVTTTDSGTTPISVVAEAGRGEGETVFEPGPVTVTAGVSVAYEAR